MRRSGKVYLVGAGPGHPGLITLRAVEVLQQADAVLYDSLVDQAMLNHARPGAELVYVGKRARSHALSQDEINQEILERARAGRSVVRLKGGDPFLFGRGGEEALALCEADIEFEVVPGVTSALAVPAYAGIPVTHRGLSSSVCIVTAHSGGGGAGAPVDWAKIACATDTLVCLMSASALDDLVDQLIVNGRALNTPTAVIQWGTTPAQQKVVGELHNIAELARAAGIEAPAITIVGEVVRLSSSLDFLSKRPLYGKRVLVTRPKHQAVGFTKHLVEFGAWVVELPIIAIDAIQDKAAVDSAIRELVRTDFVIFTSANGVAIFFDHLFDAGADARAFVNCKLCAIGPETARALEDFGLRPEIVAGEYTAEGVAEALSGYEMRGTRVLLPRAKVTRDVLPKVLAAQGSQVVELPIYRTVTPPESIASLRELVREGGLDVVTFTSSSTVLGFVSAFSADELRRLMRNVVVACIGPVTADTARKRGLEVEVIATQYTAHGLAMALADYYRVRSC